MRHTALSLALVLSPALPFAGVLPAAALTYAVDPGVDAPLSQNFSVDTKTTVPGKALAPGQYKITVIEHLSDRVILQIANKEGKVQSTFLGIFSGSAGRGNGQGPIPWSGKGGTAALRGFSFPGAPSVEFVYPKGQAVEIAKSNDDKVLAIDPASDNLPATHDRLSNQDMQIVTLWSLKASRVGPESAPAIEATRYKVPSPSAPPAPVNVARAVPPPPIGAASEPAPPAVTPRPQPRAPRATPRPTPAPRAQADMQQASNDDAGQKSAPVVRKHSIAVLPHTASNLPLLLLATFMAFAGAALMRLRRIYGR